MHTCDQCGSRFTRKFNLTRHKDRRCKPAGVRKYPVDVLNLTTHSQAGQKRPRSPEISTYNVGSTSSVNRTRSSDIPTFDGAEFGTGKPKSKETMEKLERFVRGEPAKKKSAETQAVLAQVLNAKEPFNIHPQARPKVLPSTTKAKKLHLQRKVIEKPQEVDDGLISFTPMKLEAGHGDVPRLRAVDFVTKQSRTKDNIIGNSHHDDDDDESLDISNIPPPPEKIKFLPATIDGLRARFDKLFREFRQEHKHSHRNELVFLLDELKRQGGITNDTYMRINTLLAKSLGSDIESAMESEPVLSEEDQLKKTITSTADYLIEHDKKELLEIVHEIEEDEAIIDTVLELEELIAVYLEDEFLEGESVAEKILDLVDSLSQSKHIPKSLLLKIKMLVNDIAKNRARVEEIVNRFNQAGDDRKMRLSVIEQLVKEELLSEQQYFKLAEVIDELDINRLSDVIKETKIGQGMNFLPRKTDELLDTLRQWLLEFVEKGGTALQSKISSVLNELLQRKKISEERYNELKEEHNIRL